MVTDNSTYFYAAKTISKHVFLNIYVCVCECICTNILPIQYCHLIVNSQQKKDKYLFWFSNKKEYCRWHFWTTHLASLEKNQNAPNLPKCGLKLDKKKNIPTGFNLCTEGYRNTRNYK